MFTFQEDLISDGKKFFLFKNGKPTSTEAALNLMKRGDEEFMNEFLKALKTSVDFKAYFFETPAMTKEAVQEKQFEFVLKNAPRLANVKPDEDTFEEHFKPDCSTVSFRNIGKDALLIAPCPDPGEESDFKFRSHLATFV